MDPVPNVRTFKKSSDWATVHRGSRSVHVRSIGCNLKRSVGVKSMGNCARSEAARARSFNGLQFDGRCDCQVDEQLCIAGAAAVARPFNRLTLRARCGNARARKKHCQKCDERHTILACARLAPWCLMVLPRQGRRPRGSAGSALRLAHNGLDRISRGGSRIRYVVEN